MRGEVTGLSKFFEHYLPVLRGEKREIFLVVPLDARQCIFREKVISIGSPSFSIVHPREVFRPAIRATAGCTVLVHNHPPGDPRASEEDVAVARRRGHDSELPGMGVLDHVAIGAGEHASFREAGMLRTFPGT